MRAIGYFINHDSDGICIADIENDFRKYCTKFSHQPINIFVDTTTTQSSINSKFAEMLQYISDSDSEFLVLIPNAMHLGGDLESIATAITSLNTINSKIRCMDIDLIDPLQSALYHTVLKGRSKTHSDTITKAMINKAQNGYSLGRSPFGYNKGSDGKLNIILKEASIIQIIFNLYTEKQLGLRKIVGYLNKQNINNRNDKHWNIITIRDILKNIVYIGTYNRFGFLIPKNHPAIIPKDVFHTARDILSQRKPRRQWGQTEPYLLAGIAICGYCGNKMIGSTKRQTWRRKDRSKSIGIYRYYQCQTRANESTCNYHTWKASKLEQEVVKQIGPLQEILFEHPNRLINTPNNEKRIKTAETRFVWAFKSSASGQMPISTLASYLEELNNARNYKRPSNVILNSSNKWDTLSKSEQHQLLNDLVYQVIVKDEDIQVLSNHNR